jgi:hypothetical protein
MDNEVLLDEKQFKKLKCRQIGEEYYIGDLVFLEQVEHQYRMATLSRASVLIHKKEKIKSANLVFYK